MIVHFVRGIEACRLGLASIWIVFGLLNCDTAFCKMQQSDPAPDPFAEALSENPDLFSPKLSGTSSMKIKQQYVDPQEDVFSAGVSHASQTISENSKRSSADGVTLDAQLSERIRELRSSRSSLKRPIYPQRTKPGGLVSSCCCVPGMTSKQEAFLLSQLENYDDTSWSNWSLNDLHRYLNTLMPTFINLAELNVEGMQADALINSKFLCAGDLNSRLRDALSPLSLTTEVRFGRLEITTQSSVNNSAGVLRIYDVTPLVNRVRNGAEQLQRTIEHSIQPDSWSDGSFSLQFHVVPADTDAVTTLVIGATTEIHLLVQELLDRLNMVSESGSNGANFDSAANRQLIEQRQNQPQLDDRVRSSLGF